MHHELRRTTPAPRRLQMSQQDDRVLVVDPTTGRRLSCALDPPSELSELFRTARPEEVLLDLHLPIRVGQSLLRMLEAACPGARILAHVHSRIGEPRSYRVSLVETGLSLTPLESADPVWNCGSDA